MYERAVRKQAARQRSYVSGKSEKLWLYGELVDLLAEDKRQKPADFLRFYLQRRL